VNMDQTTKVPPTRLSKATRETHAHTHIRTHTRARARAHTHTYIYIYIYVISTVYYILGTTRTTVFRGSGRIEAVVVVAEDVVEVVKVEAVGTLGYPSSCFR